MKADLWVTEKQTDDVKISFRVKKILHEESTDFQHLSVVDTYAYGPMLFLDNCVMTNIKDEFVYHEMISLVALNTHPNPQNVLVIGGGDGGVLREVSKHPKVNKATLVEIDGRVIENSKKYFPEIAAGFNSSKVKVIVDDGIKYIKENQNTFDVIIIDSTDPIGPAAGLFSAEFYQNVYDALKEDGMMVAQTESPFLEPEIITHVNNTLQEIFPLTKLYLAHIPTYPSGMWTFTIGSKKYDPEKVDPSGISDINTRYYNSDIHFASLVLPNFVKELLKSKKTLDFL